MKFIYTIKNVDSCEERYGCIDAVDKEVAKEAIRKNICSNEYLLRFNEVNHYITPEAIQEAAKAVEEKKFKTFYVIYNVGFCGGSFTCKGLDIIDAIKRKKDLYPRSLEVKHIVSFKEKTNG